MRILEKVVFPLVLLTSALVIVALMVGTWCVQLIVGIASDPNAGPYRQVR